MNLRRTQKRIFLQIKTMSSKTSKWRDIILTHILFKKVHIKYQDIMWNIKINCRLCFIVHLYVKSQLIFKFNHNFPAEYLSAFPFYTVTRVLSTKSQTAFETRTFRVCDVLFALAHNISNNQAYGRIPLRFREFYLYRVNERSRWSANSTLIDRARQFRSRWRRIDDALHYAGAE